MHLKLKVVGTLEDCLQDLRSESSAARKASLSLDIALGLSAFHSCGLVHGDIKPGNIVIQSHPTRAVIAKLSDFSGAESQSAYGHGAHYRLGTPEWQPPEVLNNDESIDWQAADVYAYGMVIATLWTRIGFISLGGSFLDPFIPYDLDRDHKLQYTTLLKTLPDADERSMINLGHKAVSETIGSPIPLASIINGCLSTNPNIRVTMAKLLDSVFVNFAQTSDRQFP